MKRGVGAAEGSRQLAGRARLSRLRAGGHPTHPRRARRRRMPACHTVAAEPAGRVRLQEKGAAVDRSVADAQNVYAPAAQMRATRRSPRSGRRHIARGRGVGLAADGRANLLKSGAGSQGAPSSPLHRLHWQPRVEASAAPQPRWRPRRLWPAALWSSVRPWPMPRPKSPQPAAQQAPVSGLQKQAWRASPVPAFSLLPLKQAISPVGVDRPGLVGRSAVYSTGPRKFQGPMQSSVYAILGYWMPWIGPTPPPDRGAE